MSEAAGFPRGMTRILVIVNPAAGRGRARKRWPFVARALRAAGVDFDAVTTARGGEAIGHAERAAGEYAAVVAAGGDGTVHEVVNGLLRAAGDGRVAALGVLPLGSGDDFAKLIAPSIAIGGRAPDWPTAVATIAGGQTRRFDAGCIEVEAPPGAVQRRYFANGMDVGFGAQGAANAAAMPAWLRGRAAYFGALAKTLVAYPRLRLTLQLDDAPPESCEATIAAVMNGRCFGSSFWVCPDARADDGLLDVMLAGALGRVAILGLVPRVMRGRHTDHPRVRMQRARRIGFESETPMAIEADGELPFPATRRVSVSVLPAALSVLVPALAPLSASGDRTA
ncbi:MAG TPA: diacylglycerol kinase family protein [Burkholderiales bacterium]|nr:diacylglycerol kinase family protein [Burkholderiales bacterium]